MHFTYEIQESALKTAILTLPSKISKEKQGAMQRLVFTLDYTSTTYLNNGRLQNQRDP